MTNIFVTQASSLLHGNWNIWACKMYIFLMTADIQAKNHNTLHSNDQKRGESGMLYPNTMTFVHFQCVQIGWTGIFLDKRETTV